MLDRDSEALAYAVYRSCKNKAEIVAEDELEQSGKRALLNFGHTFGHAIEAGVGYGNWLHGEAVAYGMLMAMRMSIKLGWIHESEYKRAEQMLLKANLPTQAPKNLSPENFIQYMSIDKKVRDGKLHLVLLKEIGNAILTSQFKLPLLNETLNECCC